MPQVKPVDNTAATAVKGGWVLGTRAPEQSVDSEKVLSLPRAVMFSARQLVLVVAMSVLNPRSGDAAPAPIWYMCDLCEVSSV